MIEHGMQAQRPPGAQGVLKLVISSSALEVRQALRRVVANMAPLALDEAGRDTLELVLAEVLNNVVEHAYADSEDGVIEVMVLQREDVLFCTVTDEGRPMPDLSIPAAQDIFRQVPLAALPEGGFGWMMIRELSRDLRYCRDDGHNRLSFALDLAAQYGPD